jgi:hypothetical protein
MALASQVLRTVLIERIASATPPDQGVPWPGSTHDA